MIYGVTESGFIPKTQEELQAELSDRIRAQWGTSIDLSPHTVLGQLVGILSEQLAELWDLGQAISGSFDPAAAVGPQLAALASITGTVPLPATRGTVTAYAAGVDGTVLPAGRVASVVNTGARFASLADATITTVSDWAAGVYAAGDRVTNLGNLYECTAPGTSAAGPTGTALDIPDGAVHWRYLLPGTALAVAPMQAEELGPVAAPSGTLTLIATPVAGWSDVTNPLDAVLGRSAETDAALRIRRGAELRRTGDAALDALRASVLAVTDVTAVTVFDNPTGTTNADGLPPHSVEVMVQGGTEADILAAIFGSVASGIQTYGTTSGTVIDSQGFTHAMAFTRPNLLPVYVTLDLLVDVARFPPDGADQVRAAVVAFGDAFLTGRDVTASAMAAQAFKVDGVLDATARIGTAPAPAGSATITANTRDLATFDTSRVVVNATAGTP